VFRHGELVNRFGRWDRGKHVKELRESHPCNVRATVFNSQYPQMLSAADRTGQELDSFSTVVSVNCINRINWSEGSR